MIINNAEITYNIEVTDMDIKIIYITYNKYNLKDIIADEFQTYPENFANKYSKEY